MTGPRPKGGRPAGPQQGQPGRSQQGQAQRNGARRPGPRAQVQQRPSRLRLFYALPLPEAVTAELVKAQAGLTDNWRRVDPEQLHVTLAYLPGVPGERVAELQEAGRELAAQFPPLRLRLRGTGYHPNTGGPRVWFVKVEGDGLRELAGGLRAELERRGFAPEGEFQPHVTLARKKGPAPRVPPRTFGLEWAAPAVELIHTFLPKDKTGPVHDPVSRFRLVGAPLPEAPLTDPAPDPNHAAPSHTAPTQATPTHHDGHAPDEERHG